jgi:hypothetical protein
VSERQQHLTMLLSEAVSDLLPPGDRPLTPDERAAFGERLAASIRAMPDVHSVEFVPATGTIRIIRTPAIVIRCPITIAVDKDVKP